MKKLSIVALALLFAGQALAEKAPEMDYGTDVASTEVQAAASEAKAAYIEAENVQTKNVDVKNEEDLSYTAVEDAYISDTEDKVETERNDKIKWPNGMQFGVGLNLVPGYNWFIGYANKDFDSFWWKRFGLRLDMTTPAAFNASAVIRDTADGYAITPEVNLWFVKARPTAFDEVTVKALGQKITTVDTSNLTFDEFEIDGERINLDGAGAKFGLKNKNFGAKIDFYPFGNTWFLGGLRLSGGYYTGTLSANGDIFFQDYTPVKGIGRNLTDTDELRFRVRKGSRMGANIDWKYHGPYAGVGFDLGLLLGAKIYFDAGVVYTKPLKIREKDINDRSLVIESCYSIGGGACDWTMLIQGMNRPDVSHIVEGIVTDVLAGQINQAITDGGTLVIDGVTYDFSAELAGLAPGADIGQDLAGWLLRGDSVTWIDDVINKDFGIGKDNVLGEILDSIRSEISSGTGDIQAEVDRIWGDYEQQKRDAINDANKAISDCGSSCKFMPMVKLGFMFRF